MKWILRALLVIVAVMVLVVLSQRINQPANIKISQIAKQMETVEPSLASDVISDEDLPPEGTRSLFDHFVAQHDGLAYPFDRLLAQIQANSPSSEAPKTVLIPHGRSLLKGQADEALPRIIAAADYEQDNNEASLGLKARGQLFLGFVERANEIEVISYNELAGRYEFQLVQNYCADCVPRIVYAQRAVCSTCHQGKAPIFPLRSWNETNAHESVAQSISDARGSSEPYFGVVIRQPLAAPERIDFLTDIANFVPVTQRLWIDTCGEPGIECRRLMLSLALQYVISPGSFREDTAEAEQLRVFQRQHMPAKGIAVASPDLINRDPLAEQQGLKGWWRKLTTRQIKLGEGATNNEDLSAFEKLPPLPSELDPLTKRPPIQIISAEDLSAVYGLAALFTLSDIKEISALSQFDMARVRHRVAQMPDDMFTPQAFVRVRMMNALLGKDRAYCCLSTDEMSEPITSAEPPLQISQHMVLKEFERYCFACHRGNPSKRLNFMSGSDEGQVLETIRQTREIRDALDWARYQKTDRANKLMPPTDSVQYQRLQRDGEKGQEALKQMRDTVPSLFGF
ncbi:MAG: hypothetical protein U0998_04300 [Moraxellaceae bacterium]|nr:hypothetical protein [Moraxellaceae bacterium]MDZ4386428.1 hypothetical protein [Moraxellaceae bacterium]